MKVLYFISLLIVALLFNACAPTPIVYTPEQIDTFAIPPSADNNLFSPPPKGYARLIMYRDDSKSMYWNDVSINYATNQQIIYRHFESFFENYYELDNGIADRALCRLNKDSSCIVNIKAGKPVLLFNHLKATPGAKLFLPVWWQDYTQGTIFTPKNQHIYCFGVESRSSFAFKDKSTCLKEYKEVYNPRHRKYQEKWFNKLIQEGDKRAYKE